MFDGDGASELVCGLVRFTPGARTNWHAHGNGQLLVCTDGVGLVGTRDGRTLVLRAGESVWTPAGEERFHGGTTETMMCHYAILDASGAAGATTWLEPVTAEQYAAAHTAAGVE
ncbi:cupin domain-containing protein [Rhodococcus opacus]|uniref:cupin domain-containing protein n=1 Tax=Rhodococcus opacus TaxID=37919 RepID=UPI001F53EE2F|nr:cupin domain-containing protein [Rhodococcus opacus]